MTRNEMEIQIHQFAEMMYKTGYEDGQKDWHNVDEEREKAYKQGLNDAWECAVKIVNSPLSDAKIMEELFNTTLPEDVLPTISASEAIAKIKEYEEEQQNIKSCDNCEARIHGCSGNLFCENYIHDEIKFRVGDIVILNCDVSGYKNVKGSKGIIERIAFDYEIKEERAFVNCGKGFVGWIRLKYLTNTGKHYPLINEILGEIQGENNDN